MARDGKQTSYESWLMVNGKDGDVFYTNEKSNKITALSSYYKRPITTETVYIVRTADSSLPEIEPALRVELINRKN